MGNETVQDEEMSEGKINREGFLFSGDEPLQEEATREEKESQKGRGVKKKEHKGDSGGQTGRMKADSKCNRKRKKART